MKVPFRTIIIEDEAAATRHLQKLLQQLEPELEIITTLTSVKTATAWLQKHPLPDVIFMDIRLSDGLSFDILNHCFIDVPIIFTTAYDEYALRAFRTSGIDYLLKPISADDLRRALAKFKHLFGQAVDWHKQYLQTARLLQKEEASRPLWPLDTRANPGTVAPAVGPRGSPPPRGGEGSGGGARRVPASGPLP